jgi:signal transduction histidine kinase
LYLPVPLLLAASVRFGGRGASGAILIITVMVLFRAMHGGEPFAGMPPGHNVLSVQLFLAVLAVPAILLAALVEELRGTNDRLSTVLDGVSDGYYTLDPGGEIVAINAKGAAWCGHDSPGELIGRKYWDIPAQRAPDAEWVRRAIQSGAAVRGEFSLPDGRWSEIRAYPSADGVSIFCHDITEQRAAEGAARSTQHLLQSSLDALIAQVAILDSTGEIIAVNASWHKAAELLARIGECYFIGANYIEECERSRPHQRRVASGIRRVLRAELSEFRCEYASDIVEGIWIQLRCTRFGSGPQLRLVVACADITEVKTTEASLRRLTGKLLKSQDEAQRRLARELHDATAQNLLGATLGIGQALRLSPKLKPVVRAALEESRALIEQSQREIRTVSYLLHPPMLDEAGLPAALRWLCEGFSKRTEIAVHLNVAADIGRLPGDIEAALFRIAQEALANVHRHSEATEVHLSLDLGVSSEIGSMIALTIKDNGKGMPIGIVGGSESGRHLVGVPTIGIGLAGMRERLRQFGGCLQVGSGSLGTTVHVTVPLPASDEMPIEKGSATVAEMVSFPRT